MLSPGPVVQPLTKSAVDLVLGTATTNVQAKIREVLRKLETELKGETMTGVLALTSPELFDKLIGHAKVEEAYKYFSSTGAQPLREDTRRRFPFAGIAFEEYNATVTLSTGATETLIPAGEGIAFPLGTGMDFVRTYGIPTRFDDAVRVAVAGRSRTIDAGRVRYRTWGGDEAERWFANVGSVGMSGAVAQRANGMSKALGGKATFFYALTRVFLEWENTEVTVTLDEGERRGRMHEKLAA